jgi:galactose mutarotase-like enzyme
MQTKISSDELTVTVNHAGAEICSVKSKKGTEFIWQGDKKVWPRHAPVLFPIVGKLKNGTFVYKENEYALSQHGFARDRIFRTVDEESSMCSFQIHDNPDTLLLYPYFFSLDISYELKANTLITNYCVANNSDTRMYFSIGGHPGFNCPASGGATFEDYFLEFEKEELQITPLENGLRKSEKKGLGVPGKKLPLNTALFANDALVFENDQINSVKLKSKKSDYAVVMKCGGWPYFGIWTKPGNKDFVCLEPWHGITDSVSSGNSISEKEGIITLNPAMDFKCSFEVTFFD